MKNNTLFTDIPLAPSDPILGITETFLADKNPKKVNLGVGVYQNGDGKGVKLQVVRKAESKILESDIVAGYTPIDGAADFTRTTQELVFGSDCEAVQSKRIATIQSPGGTGGLRLSGEFIRLFFPSKEIWLSDPSWENHKAIFEAAGLHLQMYPYYDSQSKGLNFEKCRDTLSKVKAGSTVLLHACCHNPTGSDFSQDQWKEVLDIILKNNLIPLIDFAYQGFGEGISQDRAALKLFIDAGIPFFVVNSFSKNFGLYSERVGSLSIVTSSKDDADRARSQIKRIIRTIYSTPPSRGSKIVQAIMADPILKADWEMELSEMCQRMKSMRKQLVSKLEKHATQFDFSHVLSQNGMFSYSGLSRDVVLWLREHKSIYALESGRICVAALNDHNIEYVCASIAEACSVIKG